VLLFREARGVNKPEPIQAEQVFLSYSHVDREACISLKHALE
jgi:hypothetical protein